MDFFVVEKFFPTIELCMSKVTNYRPTTMINPEKIAPKPC